MNNFNVKYLQSFGWEGSLRGMRNPLESHYRSDSVFNNSMLGVIGENDMKLCKQLIKAGASHRKFLRQIHVHADVTASMMFWKEFDTYRYTTQNSTSMMHTLGKRLLTKDDFSGIDDDDLTSVNVKINLYRAAKKKNHVDLETYWRKMISAVPQSYLYTRTIDMSYETFFTMYKNRKNHKLDEWVEFCSILRSDLSYMNVFLSVLEV